MTGMKALGRTRDRGDGVRLWVESERVGSVPGSEKAERAVSVGSGGILCPVNLSHSAPAVLPDGGAAMITSTTQSSKMRVFFSLEE